MDVERFDDSFREGITIGNLVFVSYGNIIGEFIGITDNGLYRVKTKNHIGNYSRNFIRKPTEDELKWYNAELKAIQWLKDRQRELSALKFRCFETDLWREQKELLREAGYFVYDLRDWDEGNGYNIEINVCVNHIGCWITDTDLKPYMNEGSWIGIDELELAQIDDIPYIEIIELLKKGEALNFANKKGV